MRVKGIYGNASILFLSGSGSQSALHGAVAVERMLARFGGYTRTWGIASLTHSTLEKIPWLEEAVSRRDRISSYDAEKLGISSGDDILIFNDRGRIVVRAEVTEGIIPGVIDVPEGAWFDMDADGIDRGGCANILTPSEHLPGGAWAANTALVEARKA